MKVTAFLPATLLSLAACQPAAESTTTAPATTQEPATATAPASPAAGTGTEATLTQGTYRGTLPCADCSGIEVALTFAPDHTLTSSTLYQGHDKKPTIEKGTWRLAPANTVRVSLSQDPGEQRLYRLTSPATITMLNADSTETTGEMAPNYVLKRS